LKNSKVVSRRLTAFFILLGCAPRFDCTLKASFRRITRRGWDRDSMAGRADILGSVMKKSENKFFLEKPTWKLSTGASPMVDSSRRRRF
jgi:hypothetical protein